MSVNTQEAPRTASSGKAWPSLLSGVLSLVSALFAFTTANYLFLLSSFVLAILTFVLAACAATRWARGAKVIGVLTAILALLAGISLPFT